MKANIAAGLMGSEDRIKLFVGSIKILSRTPKKNGDSIKSTLNTGRYYHAAIVKNYMDLYISENHRTFRLSLLPVLAHFFR